MMTKESMADYVEARLAAVSPTQFEGGEDPTVKKREYLEAFLQGIIDEILANAEVTTISGAPDSEHTGIISA